jgi:hypothetical protein
MHDIVQSFRSLSSSGVYQMLQEHQRLVEKRRARTLVEGETRCEADNYGKRNK